MRWARETSQAEWDDSLPPTLVVKGNAFFNSSFHLPLGAAEEHSAEVGVDKARSEGIWSGVVLF